MLVAALWEPDEPAVTLDAGPAVAAGATELVGAAAWLCAVLPAGVPALTSAGGALRATTRW